ncbi:MAG: hypothetical protein IH820_07980 [Bacteroidetes bacterium]|nr:hypothetical protein [Bacteroidota bacterium]
MRSVTPSSFTSLLSALFVVVALMLAGCTADSLTGPVLGPEVNIQGNGDHNITGNGDHNATGNGDHNKNTNGDHNKNTNGDHN